MNARRRALRSTLAFIPLLLVGCAEDHLLPTPEVPAEVRAVAIRLRVDLEAGSVQLVQAPPAPGVSMSVVGNEGVSLVTSNVTRTLVREGRALVRFDVAITNTFVNIELGQSSFPQPPPGATGIVLFPFETITSGDRKTVVPSTDWDGAPHAFFGNPRCANVNDYCFRWEAYPAPLAPGATSEARTVGFEVPSSATTFEVLMLVAADLRELPPPPPPPPAPVMALSSTTASFTSNDGVVSPAATAILVSNSGTGTLGGLTATVSYPEGQPAFLTAELSATTAPSLLTLTPSAGSLANGTYSATVSIAAADGVANAPQTVAVTFVITSTPPPPEEPAIGLSSTSASFTSTDGVVSPAATAILVSNSGTGTLSGLTATVSYPSGQPAFLTAELSSTTGPSLLTLTPSAGTLVDGTYTATVSIASAGVANSPQTVAVTFVITTSPGEPTIGLSSNIASFSSNDGVVSPAAISVVVTNSGTGTLSGLTATVSYPSGQPAFLAATLGGTTAPSLLTLTPSTGLLRDGSYSATVTVAGDGVSNSPQTVAVTLVVTGSAIANAIYVSINDPTAADLSTCGMGPTGSGTGNFPCRTITRGNLRSLQTGRPEIRVADGRYTERVNVISGKQLLGGYDPNTWRRHLSTTATIIDGVLSQGNHDHTVFFNTIITATLFEGFVVRGPINNKPSGNSYALYVTASNANLVIRRNVIYAGSAGPGTDGTAGVANLAGVDGQGREANPAGYDAFITTGSSACDATSNRSLTNGGVRSYSGDIVSGGNGGGNQCPPTGGSGLIGANGNASNGPGGAAGVASQAAVDAELRIVTGSEACVFTPGSVMDGSPGGPGSAGASGVAGAGGSNALGQVIGAHWEGANGTLGEQGANGGGGAGGSGGAGALCVNCNAGKDRLGGHGGGGGSGGGGGGGGGFGTSGGAAFGIFILTSTPVVTENTIVGGVGGRGGAGGSGAAGSVGGRGGNGGLASVFCTGAGGRGGDGGPGGHGAGGGGGAGGTSFGIFALNAGAAPNYCTTAANTVSGGSGGLGGPGGPALVSPGGAGVVGVVRPCEIR